MRPFREQRFSAKNGVSKNVENPLTWRALTTPESLLDNIGKSIRRRAKEIVIRTGIAVRPYAKPRDIASLSIILF
jgi:hypothetical protein